MQRRRRQRVPHQARHQPDPADQPRGAGGRTSICRTHGAGWTSFSGGSAPIRSLFAGDGLQGRENDRRRFPAAIAHRANPQRRRTDPGGSRAARPAPADDFGPGRPVARGHRTRGAAGRQRRRHLGDPATADLIRDFQMIRITIVGLGRWGRNLAEAAHGHARLKIVRAVETDIAAAQDFAGRHRLDLTADLNDVLADPAIDAVLLATPHSLHPAQVIACAAARKQVFCEKPLALRRADAARMFEACRNAGVVLAVGHNRRFWPSMAALRGIVAGGEFGTLLHIEGHNSNENSQNVKTGWRLSPEESPGGGLPGAGLHVLDAFVSLLGPVRNVYATLHSRDEGPPPLDIAMLAMEFVSGVTGTLSTVRATPFYWRVHVFGSKGSVEVLDEIT